MESRKIISQNRRDPKTQNIYCHIYCDRGGLTKPPNGNLFWLYSIPDFGFDVAFQNPRNDLKTPFIFLLIRVNVLFKNGRWAHVLES